MSGQLLVAGDGPAARCKHCGKPAVGPCARCRGLVCGDCCVLTDGGVGTFAVCLTCERRGGATLRGISKPGEIVWSRIYVQDEALYMDIGRGCVVDLPREETERRWELTTPQWPIMSAVTYGVSRDQLMAKHQANHIQVAYANDAKAADECMFAKAAMARALGMKVNVCGTLSR